MKVGGLSIPKAFEGASCTAVCAKHQLHRVALPSENKNETT
jgi:hypothetical protein